MWTTSKSIVPTDLMVSNFVLYLMPWDARFLMMTSKETLGGMENSRRIVNIVDHHVLNSLENSKRTEHVDFCHRQSVAFMNSSYIRREYHDCHSTYARCRGAQGLKCHNNDDGREKLHWDVEESYAPLKCVECGRIFVHVGACVSKFFLRREELTCLETFNKKFYDLRTIRWMSYMKNRTMTPLYRWNVSRAKREGWMNSAVDRMERFVENSYNGFCDIKLFCRMSRPFADFRTKGKRHKDLKEMISRTEEIVIPSIHRILTEAAEVTGEIPRSTFGIERCMSMAMTSLPDGLKAVRRYLMHQMSEREPELRTCYRLEGPNHDVYEAFVDGEAGMEETLQKMRDNNSFFKRKEQITVWMMSQGVYAREIMCNTLDDYSKGKSDVDEEDVIRCIVESHIRPRIDSSVPEPCSKRRRY